MSYKKRAGNPMWRRTLGATAIIVASLIPTRLFAFEASLEGEVDRLSVGVKAAGLRAYGTGLTRSPEDGLSPEENETPATAPALPDLEQPGGVVNLGGRKRLRSAQHLSFVGQLPALPPLPEISLQEFLSQVETYNLDLAAQELNTPIAQAQATAARVYPDPALNAIYGGDVSHHQQPSSVGAGLSQTILLGGKIAARTAAASSAVEQSKAQVADFRQNLRCGAAREFVDALAQSLIVHFHNQALSRAEDLLDPEIAPHASRPANKALRINLLRARIAVLDERDALLTAQSSLQQKLLDLALLMGRNDRPVRPRGNLQLAPRHFVLDQLVSRALATRADIEAARQALAGAKAQLQVVKANRWPDLTLQGNYAHFTRSTNMIDPSPTWDAAFVGLSIPFPVSNLNTGDLEGARTSELQTARVLHATQSRAEIEIRKAFERYSIALDRVQEYNKEILGDAEEIYAAQKVPDPSATLLEILDVQRAYNETYLDYFNALNEQAQALIDLERAANIWDINL
jgi:outer membrane protein, heavy metal efflux system